MERNIIFHLVWQLRNWITFSVDLPSCSAFNDFTYHFLMWFEGGERKPKYLNRFVCKEQNQYFEVHALGLVQHFSLQQNSHLGLLLKLKVTSSLFSFWYNIWHTLYLFIWLCVFLLKNLKRWEEKKLRIQNWFYQHCMFWKLCAQLLRCREQWRVYLLKGGTNLGGIIF